MASTPSNFLFDFASFAKTRYFSGNNQSIILKKADMFAQPSAGRGSRKTTLTARDVSNFYFSQAAPQISESAEVAKKLREMQYLGAAPAYFGEGTAGEIFDRIIENLAAARDGKPNVFAKEALVLPHDITLCVAPYRLVFIWRNDDGSVARANTYVPMNDGSHGGGYIKKVTYLDRVLFAFAAQHVSETGPAQTGAVLAGTTPDVRQTEAYDHGLDGSDTHTSNLPRGRVRINSTPTPRRRKNG